MKKTLILSIILIVQNSGFAQSNDFLLKKTQQLIINENYLEADSILKEVINKPIDLLKLKFNDLSELQKIKYLKKDEGKTSIKFELQNKQNKLVFDLKDKRKIDLKQLNSLKMVVLFQ